MTPGNVRQVILAVIEERVRRREGLVSTSVLKETAERLNVGGNDQVGGQAILTCWHDLMQSGQFAWGIDIGNPNPPWFHVTDRGREMLKHLSRDSANPDGYLAYLDARLTLDPVARSYLTEALATYNATCFKATAVMVGAAAERLVLKLADVLKECLTAAGKKVPKGMADWKVKSVRDALTQELDAHKADMPRELAESYAAYWLAFAEQTRRVWNDAGHPESIDPVTPESVHAALLIFPELAKLASDLADWMKTFYR